MGTEVIPVKKEILLSFLAGLVLPVVLALAFQRAPGVGDVESDALTPTRAAVDEIVRLENLEATKEEIAQALAVICRQNGMTMEQMKEHYDAALEQAVVNSVLTSKAMRLIRDAAVVEE